MEKITDVTAQPKKKRQSNIELLRIISMLLIISFHYVYHSGYAFKELTYNSFIVKAFYMFGELGVNIFLLITGYFMVNSKMSFKKLILLILEINFYYIISIILGTKLGIYKFNNSPRGYFMLFFTVIFGRYWFITAYILVYVLSPYFNILIHSMNKNTYKKFILTMLTLWCIIPTIFGLFSGPEKILGFSRYGWAIVIYFVGAYIRLYPIKIYKKMSTSIIIAVISYAVTIAGILIIYKFRDFFKYLGTTEVAYFWPPNTIPIFVLSVSMLEIFLKIKINYNVIINKLASTTLAIYLIHDGILKTYIWNNIFKTKVHLASKYSIIHIIIGTVSIFLVGAIIDLIRQFLEKITVKKFFNTKLYSTTTRKIKKLGNKVFNLI